MSRPHAIPAAAATGPLAARRRHGFTFIEVMFSVMILGFGVIMIAALIPVALRITQQTREGNAGTAICETGFHYLQTVWGSYDAMGRSPVANIGGLPATDTDGRLRLVTFPAWNWQDAWDNPPPNIPLFYETGGSRVDSMRGDTAWIPFYSRAGILNPQVALVGVRARNVPRMSVSPEAINTPDPNFLLPGNFYASDDNCPLPVDFRLLDNSENYSGYVNNLFIDRGQPTKLEADVVEITNPINDSAMQQKINQALVEGAAVVLLNEYGQIRILRLSSPARTDATGFVWTLAPGGDVRVTAGPGGFTAEFVPGATYRGYLVGRMLRNPNKPWNAAENRYVGPSQVVQILDGKVLP